MADSSESSGNASERPAGDDISSCDTMFDLLANRRRRVVVGVLLCRDRSMTVSDLTTLLAEREHETVITDISGDDVTSIHTALYHVYVPKLADAGVVEYDEARGVLEPTDRLERLAPYV